MVKKILIGALAAVCCSAMAQTTDTSTKQVYGRSLTDLRMGMNRSIGDLPAPDQYVLNSFLDRLPGGYELVILKAINNNYMQAMAIRDETVAQRMAMMNNATTVTTQTTTTQTTTDQTAVPPANGTQTTTQTTTTQTTAVPPVKVQKNMDLGTSESRPMRMLMMSPGPRDIDYDQALDILGSGLSEDERTVLRTVFRPQQYGFGALSVMNERPLDAIIRLIRGNAMMIDTTHTYPSVIMPNPIPPQ